MNWSFARDKGMPLSQYLNRISKNSQIPVIGIIVVAVLAALLVLIYISSYAAFDDVISLTVTGFYASYLLPCAFLLYRRVKGHIQSRNPGQSAPMPPPTDETLNKTAQLQVAESPEQQLVWGPWHLSGIIGTMNNAYACIYMIFVIFWSVWPPVTPVSANTMNYSIVVTGGVLILSSIWYVVRGRREYEGPINETGEAAAQIGPMIAC